MPNQAHCTDEVSRPDTVAQGTNLLIMVRIAVLMTVLVTIWRARA